MKKMTLLFAAVCGLLFVGGCNDNEPASSLEPPASSSAETTRHRSLEEAMEYADDWFSQIDRVTRVTDRKVKSVQYLTAGSGTRSSVRDTLMYLVNYEDENGFALLGSPIGSKPIYAISDDGRLLMSDTVYNKGLAEFIRLAQSDAVSAIINPIAPIDTNSNKKTFVTTRKVSPKIPNMGISVCSEDIRNSTPPSEWGTERMDEVIVLS